MRLAIAIPCGDRVGADFAISLAGLTASLEVTRDIVLVQGKSSMGACAARNQCVEAAFAYDADHILMIDSDMIFPPYSADRLFEAKKSIVGVTYRRRGASMDVLGKPVFDGGLHPMEIIPLGMTLIDMAVFRKLTRPWFWLSIDSQSRELVGEDIVFCRDAQAAGFGVWCDWDLSKDVGHQCLVPLTLAMS